MGIARKRAVNIHPESRSKSGQISIFLLRPHDQVTLGGRFVPCRPQGAGVLACHLQLVRTRSSINEVRSLLVPSSISPSRPASPPPPPRPRAQRCTGAFPPPPVYLFHPYPLLSSAVPLVDQPRRCVGSVQQEDRPAANCHS